MTRGETVKLLAVFRETFPSAFRGVTRESGEAMVNIWTSALETCPSDVGARAAKELIEKSRFMPSVAEMLEQVRRVGKDMLAETSCDIALGRDVPIERRRRLYGLAEGRIRNAECEIPNSEEGNRRLQIEDPAAQPLP